MYYLNCSISELPSFTKDGTEARYGIGLLLENQLAINDKIKALIEKYEHLIFEAVFVSFAKLHFKGG